jgi:hypothetical protein
MQKRECLGYLKQAARGERGCMDDGFMGMTAGGRRRVGTEAQSAYMQPICMWQCKEASAGELEDMNGEDKGRLWQG